MVSIASLLLTSTWQYLRCDVGLEEGEFINRTVYYYDGPQRYEQFLQVGRLYRALILLSLALYNPSVSVSSIFMVLCT